MKLSRIILFIISGLLLQVPFLSCKKYLDQKPSKNVVIPHRLSDLQALLDNYQIMNRGYQAASEDVSDSYYISNSTSVSVFNAQLSELYIRDPKEDNIYLNKPWREPYQVVLYSNVVLEFLPKVEDADNTNVYNDIKGQALFFRSFAFWQVAQLFCRPYSNTAAADPGIVLRFSIDINEPSSRSTVQETYDQIIGDLEEAARLLPEHVIAPTRPNKAAAYGLLARVYLSMRDYTNAATHAALCLERDSSLLDFNSLNAASVTPIPELHSETIFWSVAIPGDLLSPSNSKIDSNLYRLYDSDDLRKVIYFQKNSDSSYRFKGSYGFPSSSYFPFYGIAGDEMYLIRAECYAKGGNKDSGLYYLNRLLEKRWKANTFSPVTAASAAAALDTIRKERRKELVFRGLRWSDLRRYNLEGANITLRRDINGTIYELPPDDLRWVLLIPRNVINLSDIEQNPR